MAECRCHHPPFDYCDFITRGLGVDTSRPALGDVTVDTCRHCGAHWLQYRVEYEAFSESGRWFRGLVSEGALAAITPENAILYLENLPWYFAGGSYYRSRGTRISGSIRLDL